MNKLIFVIKTIKQLGWKSSFQFAVYQLLLKIGWYQVVQPAKKHRHAAASLYLQTPPFKERTDQVRKLTGDRIFELITSADEICAGNIRLFGGEPVPLELAPVHQPGHWSKYHSNQLGEKDIKTVWEPGRFGWGLTLARAFSLTGEEKYPRKFWEYLIKFKSVNPVNSGPHWSSAQEVALRLISLVFSYSLLEDTASPETKHILAEMLAEHAERIPATLIYAQAQRNNHLLTEAAGLYTAGVVLPRHPKAAIWKTLGWKYFNAGIADQIEEDGTYIQHSTNYHRLMLHTALWMHSLAGWQGKTLPDNTQAKLTQAYRWLLTITDPETGQAPNLGANDGANILPLSSSDFSDFRPVLQAAGTVFAKERPFPAGSWDEPGAWLLPSLDAKTALIEIKSCRASLRCVKHRGRPSHSDQLHVDLWWQGLNIALDAGTYSYNSAYPWDNSLKGADVHNTVTLNGKDHMQSAGRFRWVDVAQGRILESRDGLIKATHDGYRALGVEHVRELKKVSDQVWAITDTIKSFKKLNNPITTRCHWLLPDWEFQVEEKQIKLKSPRGWISISFNSQQIFELDIAKAGKQLVGSGHCPPYRGWVSKTYLHKEPTLSLAFTIKAVPPFNFSTSFRFPN
jgi:hypothetical protein